MLCIKTLDNLVHTVRNWNEVLIFSSGREGRDLIDYLTYSNLLYRICCIVSKRVNEIIFPERNYKNVTVLPLEALVHFRESAVIIVAMDKSYHEAVDKGLTKFGFKNIVFLDERLFELMRVELKRFLTSTSGIEYFVSHLSDRLTRIERRIEEQNELCTVNTAAFEAYRNCFRGRKVVIIGSGPTLKFYKPMKDAVHIGVNLAWQKEDLELDYLFVNDANGREILQPGFEKIKEKVFIPRRVQCSGTDRNFSEDIFMTDKVVRYYWESYEIISNDLYPNICCHPLANFHSTIFSAIHFALFTQPKELYFVGCDATNVGHFYDKPGEEIPKSNNMTLNYVKLGYARMKIFAHNHYPETQIVSINPVGLKGLFRDVYTDEYKESLLSQEK